MKNITIAGNIGKDAVTRQTQKGDAVTGWSVAVDDGFGQDKRTLWFDCSMWGGRGEKVAQYLTKGTKVAVSGDLSTREHEGRTYLTVRVSEVTLQGGGDRQERPDPQDFGSRRNPAPAGHGGGDLDDDIPFMREDRA